MEARGVGYGFNPTDEQLVGHFLRKKLKGELEADCPIPELNIYNWEPAHLFLIYDYETSDGRQCFFLRPRGCKRTTQHGFWKGTGGERDVRDPDTGEPIWIKRYLVYHEGRQPKGHRSDVAMHEYHLKLDTSDGEFPDPTAWVLCRIINRESKKAKPTAGKKRKSATVSASSDLSGPSNLNSAQATPGVTAESDYPSEMLNTSLPDQTVPVPDQQPQTCNEQHSFYDDNWPVEGPSDGSSYVSYFPGDSMNLLNFSGSTSETQTCTEQCSAYDDNCHVDGPSNECSCLSCFLNDGIGLEDLQNSDKSKD